jgi:hypothetical protein
MARKIKAPTKFWRTYDPNGVETHCDTREEVERAAMEIAIRFNASAPIEEWSADHPQDEINRGWACVGVQYAPGKEPTPRPGRRTSSHAVPVGSDSEVWGFDDATSFFRGVGGRWIRGVVKEVTPTRPPVRPGVCVTFEDGREALAVEYAVAHVLKEAQQ